MSENGNDSLARWKPSEDDIRKLMQSNQQFFEPLTKQVQKLYGVIEKKVTHFRNLNKVLLKYNWFYSFSIPEECYNEIVDAYNSGEDIENKINSFFVRYFTKDNYSALEKMVKEWNNNPYFKTRMEIINDCVRTLKNEKPGYNPSNVVLPPLIAQIDGIMTDFIEKEGFKFDKTKKKWISPDGEEISVKKAYQSIKTDLDSISEYPNTILLNVLFQSAFHGDELQVLPSFSRHKIMHGESIDYGNIENVIRAFLILEFLSCLE